VLTSGTSTVAYGLPSAKLYLLVQTSIYATGHIALTMNFLNCGNIATASLMLIFTKYKCMWVNAISRHCLVALPDKKSAFNSQMQTKRLLP